MVFIEIQSTFHSTLYCDLHWSFVFAAADISGPGNNGNPESPGL
jgi:hypothetical protein